MDYEKMWNKLKTKIEKDLEYHESGAMQSISESIEGKIKCEEFLEYMLRIESEME